MSAPLSNAADQPERATMGRRTLFKAAAGAGLGYVLFRPRGGEWLTSTPAALGRRVDVSLAATDGWISFPVAANPGDPGVAPVTPFFPDVLAPEGLTTFSFGFRDVTGFSQNEIEAVRGQTQTSAPILDVTEGDDVHITVHNLGMTMRPDLADGHTIHWHGFPNQIPYFDGVPETSVAVPVGRHLTYRFLPRDPGTYMYHCHFEDVEHVQMGMIGVILVRPSINPKWAYPAASTAFDREFALLLSEVDVESHWQGAHIQQPDWSEFRPTMYVMNGRVWPDTIAPNRDPATAPESDRLRFQPNSSLIQGNSGETVLLRLANLGFRSHALQLDGLTMRVVGQDAKPLVPLDPDVAASRPDYLPTGGGRGDISFSTNNLDIAPGRSFDVLLQLPSVSDVTDIALYDRSAMAPLGSGGAGGMRTVVRVYPAGTLAAQVKPSQLLGPDA
jgi:FtsP/CotA-like multicopper oxidase with cupredoxin domain